MKNIDVMCICYKNMIVGRYKSIRRLLSGRFILYYDAISDKFCDESEYNELSRSGMCKAYCLCSCDSPDISGNTFYTAGRKRSEDGKPFKSSYVDEAAAFDAFQAFSKLIDYTNSLPDNQLEKYLDR